MENLINECAARLEHINQKIDSLFDSFAPVESINALNFSYSQFGEDIFIMNIFRSLGIQLPSYIDIGANHPFKISNTAYMHEIGCNGITVEANPNLHSEFMLKRPNALNICCGVGSKRGTMCYYMIDEYSGRNGFCLSKIEPFLREYPLFSIKQTLDIEIKTLQDIIDINNGIMPQYMSIDIEGMESDVIQSYNFDPALDVNKLRSRTPIILTVEMNDKYLEEYLIKCDYILYFKINQNYTFIKKKFYSKL